MYRIRHPLIVVAVLLIFVFQSRAASSDFLEYLNEHHYGTVPTETDDRNESFVDAMINGRKVHFKLDTGSSLTCITRNCAERLGLSVKDTAGNHFGMGGKVSGVSGIAHIESFKINNWEINHLSSIQVLPRDSHLGGADGLFGFDSLYLNAAIITIGAKGFMIRPGVMGRGAPIDDYMLKNGFTCVTLAESRNRILVNGTLNGHPLRAQIDCGCSYSAFGLDYLKKVGANPYWIPWRSEGVDGRVLNAEGFTPNEMSLGSYRVPPQMMSAEASPAVDGGDINALLGFDLLAAHRAVIDAGSGKLWLK